MGLLTKTEEIHCPVCGESGTLKSPRFSVPSPTSAKCPKCGTHLTAICCGASYELLAGHTDNRETQTKNSTQKTEVGNAMYWEERYGTNWRKAHDDFMNKHGDWLAKHACTDPPLKDM